MFNRQKIDLSEERRILSYMITSTHFLKKIKDIAKPNLFQSSFSRTVAQWIWEYYDYTKEAPEKSIEDIYLKKEKEIRSEEEKELIFKFLQKLNTDWQKMQIKNVEYTTKNALDYFKLRSLEQLQYNLEDCVKNHDAGLGEKLISEYRRVEHIFGKGVDLLRDRSAIAQAFNKESEYLFSYPGQLGECISPFMRGDFFAIMGAMKRGKTHYLWYTAYRALMIGFKVLFISLEMNEQQMLRRMWQTMVGQPVKNQPIKMPYFCEGGKRELLKIEQKTKQIRAIDLSKIAEKQKFYRKSLRTGELKLINYPSYGVSVKDIEQELANLEYYENYIPDVLVIDYADILRPINERVDYRHQLDTTWKALRGIAQEKSILVVTGSQTGRQGMKRDVDATDVAEDVRKLAHVTKMISLNQNELEKEDGVMRIKVVVQREGKQFGDQIIVLQCYDIGRPYIDSRKSNEVDLTRYKLKKS